MWCQGGVGLPAASAGGQELPALPALPADVPASCPGASSSLQPTSASVSSLCCLPHVSAASAMPQLPAPCLSCSLVFSWDWMGRKAPEVWV